MMILLLYQPLHRFHFWILVNTIFCVFVFFFLLSFISLFRRMVFFLSSINLLVYIWSYYELYGFEYINMFVSDVPTNHVSSNISTVLCCCIEYRLLTCALRYSIFFSLSHLIEITFTIPAMVCQFCVRVCPCSVGNERLL